jgi:hypothetical protein
MQHAIPHCGFYVVDVHDLGEEVFLQSLEVRERETMMGVLYRSFAMVGS